MHENLALNPCRKAGDWLLAEGINDNEGDSEGLKMARMFINSF